MQYTKNSCSNDYCPISQEEFTEKHIITLLPCNHGFVKGQVETWLEKQCPECPICRYALDSIEVEEEERESTGGGENRENEENEENSREITNRNRGNLIRSLNSIESIIHPFGRNQIFETIPHTYIPDTGYNEEEELNRAIINSLQNPNNDNSSTNINEDDEDDEDNEDDEDEPPPLIQNIDEQDTVCID